MRAEHLTRANPDGSATLIDFDLDDVIARNALASGSHNQIPKSRFDNSLRQAIDAWERLSGNESPDSQTINIETLPAPIRNYIRLQSEITGRDIGQMEAVALPGGVQTFSQHGTRHLEEKRKKERWQLYFFLLMLQMYNQMHAQTWVLLQDTRARLEDLRDRLQDIEDRAGFNGKSNNLSDQITDYLDGTLSEYEDQMRHGRPPPSETQMRGMQKSMAATLDLFETMAMSAYRFSNSAANSTINIARNPHIQNAAFTMATSVGAGLEEGVKRSANAARQAGRFASDLYEDYVADSA